MNALAAIVRTPQVLIAWAVDRLRRLPGAGMLGRLAALAVPLLIVGAVLVALAWSIQPSPQRISLAELAAGQLSRLQSWIIVSGSLEAIDDSSAAYVYRLSDSTTPHANLIVRSEQPLQAGLATVSGHIEGGREPVPEGFDWSARLEADSVLAEEATPPWLAVGMVGLAVAIVLGRRSEYPVFVRERPRDTGLRRRDLTVGVRRESEDVDDPPRAARLELGSWAAEPVVLHASGSQAAPVRLHSSHTSAEVGVEWRLGHSSPAMRLREPAEDLMLIFRTREDRDAAYTAMAAEVAARTGAEREPRD